MKDWIECEECSEEFKIISPSIETIKFCPYCGFEISVYEEDEDE